MVILGDARTSSLKSPRRTSYWSSIEIRDHSSKLLSFWENRDPATDKQTNEQTNKQVNRQTEGYRRRVNMRWGSLDALMGTGNYIATSNNMMFVHWPLMGGLLHLVQQGRDWAAAVRPVPSLLYQMTYSGRFTHISAHPWAVGRAQDRESSPVKEQCSTTVSRNQPIVKGHSVCHYRCLPESYLPPFVRYCDGKVGNPRSSLFYLLQSPIPPGSAH